MLPDTNLESVKQEVLLMVHRAMARILVVNDQSGRESRGVIREAVLRDMNQLKRDLVLKMETSWPTSGSVSV